MKEKYFGTIKTVGIIFVALIFLGCIVPYVGYFSDGGVGVPHTTVTYYRFQTIEELKDSTKIGKQLYDKWGKERFEILVKDCYDVFREKEITLWNKKMKKQMIPELLDNTKISGYQLIMKRSELWDLLEVIMIKDRINVYRNWTEESLNITPDVNNEFYTSLVMMSIALLVSAYSVLKYGKESRFKLTIFGFVAALIGAVACLCTEIRLGRYLREVKWPDGAKVWTIGPYVAGITYGLLLIYTVAVVVIEFLEIKKVKHRIDV